MELIKFLVWAWNIVKLEGLEHMYLGRKKSNEVVWQTIKAALGHHLFIWKE